MPKKPKSFSEIISPTRKGGGYRVPGVGKYGDDEVISPGHARYLRQLEHTANWLRQSGLSAKEIAEEWSGEEYGERRFGKVTGTSDIFKEMQNVLTELSEKLKKPIEELERGFIKSGKSLKDFTENLEKSTKKLDTTTQYLLSSTISIIQRFIASGITAGGGGMFGGGTGAEQISAFANILTAMAPVVSALTEIPFIGSVLGVGGAVLQAKAFFASNYINFLRSAYKTVSGGGLEYFTNIPFKSPAVQQGLIEELALAGAKYGFTPEDMVRNLTILSAQMGAFKSPADLARVSGLTTFGLGIEQIGMFGGMTRRIGGAQTTAAVTSDLMSMVGLLVKEIYAGGKSPLLGIDIQNVLSMAENIERIAMKGVNIQNVAEFYAGLTKTFSEMGYSKEEIARMGSLLYTGIARPQTPAMEAFLLQSMGFKGGLEQYVTLRAQLERPENLVASINSVLKNLREYAGGDFYRLALVLVNQFGLSFTEAIDIAKKGVIATEDLKKSYDKKKDYEDKLSKLIDDFADANIPDILKNNLPTISKQLLLMGTDSITMVETLTNIQSALLNLFGEAVGKSWPANVITEISKGSEKIEIPSSQVSRTLHEYLERRGYKKEETLGISPSQTATYILQQIDYPENKEKEITTVSVTVKKDKRKTGENILEKK